MKLARYIKVVLYTLMLCFTVSAAAQSNADKLFMEGQQLMKTMTVDKQQQAIKKFTAAKIAYTPAEKKQMCDNQITICNKNIQTIREKAKAAQQKKQQQDSEAQQQQQQQPEPVKKDTHKNVQLELSKTRLDFKAEPKEGYTQTVKVKCNYDDWSIAEKPDWVTISMAGSEFWVKVDNNAGDDRSGIVKVQCGNVVKDLIINQSKLKGFKKMVKSVRETFDI